MFPNYQPNYSMYRSSNEIQYVNGLESAKAYPMSPNQTTILMDSTDSKFYVKRTDASGFSDIKTYVFTEFKEEKPEVVNYSNEIESLKAEISGLKNQMNNLSKALEKPVKTPKNNPKEAIRNESYYDE